MDNHRRNYSVLVCEQSDERYQAIAAMLKQARGTFEPAWARDLTEANQSFLEKQWDCLLVGELPSAQAGLDWLAARAQDGRTPLIALIGDENAAEALEESALAAGAADSLRMSELSAALLARVIQYGAAQKTAGTSIPVTSPRKPGATRVGRRRRRQAPVRVSLAQRRRKKTALQRYSLLANLPEALVAIDANFDITAWNPAAERLFGWSAEEVLGRSLFDVMRLQISRAEVGEALSAFTRSGRYQIEGAQRRKDGATVIVEMTATGLFDQQGRIKGYIFSARDVTERKHSEQARERLLASLHAAHAQAEQLAAESQRRAAELDGVFKALSDGVVIFGTEDTPVLVNPATVKLLGIDPTGVHWKGMLDQFQVKHANGRALAEEERPSLRIQQGEVVYRELYRMVNIRGEKLTLMVSGAPLRLDDQIIGRVVVMHDYTDQEQTLADLEAERIKLGTVFANAPEAIVLADRQGKIIFKNPMAESLYIQSIFSKRNGKPSPVEAFFQSDGQKLWPEDLPLTRSVRYGETHVNYEIGLRMKDNQTRYLLASSAPIMDRKGAIQGAVGVFQDITQRKFSEDRMQKHARDMEVSHYLTQFRDREHLNIAHELHDGPLQELIGLSFRMAELLRMTETGALQDGLRGMSAQTHKLIRDIRGFCNDMRPPVLGRFGIDRALRSYAEKFEADHPAIQLQLDLETDPHLPVEVRIVLFRIFKELMTNIARHAQANRVRVILRFDARNACLTVEDDGQGFTPPLEWVDLARQGHLGLVGVQERAAAVEGNVLLSSMPGEGTRVEVTIPLEEVSAAAL